ncbi:MAG: hypothetical protein ACTSRU_08635 [Candidatus Hodarchaeales archaeon]
MKNKDLKEDSVIPSDDQEEKDDESLEESEEESLSNEESEEESKEDPTEELQETKKRLEKAEKEKENYKKGMLKYKKQVPKRGLSEDLDDSSQKVYEKTIEDVAVSQFTEKYPELEDKEKWSEVVENYNAKNGKGSISSITEDLERAYFLTRYEKGEIDSLKDEAFKKGKREGMTDSQIANMSSVSKTGSKSLKKSGDSLSKGAIKIAEKMRVDTKKLAEEDDSLTAEIKL